MEYKVNIILNLILERYRIIVIKFIGSLSEYDTVDASTV